MNIFKILILGTILINCISSQQEIEGIYQIDSKEYFSSINLKTDSTYEFKFRGDCCWVWQTIKGNWSTNLDTLYLEENKDELDFKIDEYLVGEYQTEANEESFGKFIHKYLIKEKRIIGLESNYLDSNMVYKLMK